jgi:hypothetical protein
MISTELHSSEYKFDMMPSASDMMLKYMIEEKPNEMNLRSHNTLSNNSSTLDSTPKVIEISEQLKLKPTRSNIDEHLVILSSIKPKIDMKAKISELFHLARSNRAELQQILESPQLNPFATLEDPHSSIDICIDRIDYPHLYSNISTLNPNQNNMNINNHNESFWFVYYQHLRKAGGTGFCDLAKSNLPRRAIPPYYCMPDNKV